MKKSNEQARSGSGRAGVTAAAPFDGRRFRNARGRGGRTWWELMKWGLTRQAHPWPRSRRNTLVCCLPEALESGALAATFVNHATFLLQIDGLNLLTDPVFSDRVGPLSWVGPRRVRAPGVPFDQLPRIDVVLLSHNHYDHCDVPTLRRLHQSFAPMILTGLGNGRLLRRQGWKQVVELDWWQHHALPNGLSVTYTPAQHFSCRGLFDRDCALWGGFYLRGQHQRVYFVGDSGYCDLFAEVRRRLGAPDLALIPIGAYAPRWIMQPIHLNFEEAVQVHHDLQARLSLGMHFGTFPITDEGIDEPAEALRATLKTQGLKPGAFLVPDFGQTVVVRRNVADPPHRARVQ